MTQNRRARDALRMTHAMLTIPSWVGLQAPLLAALCLAAAALMGWGFGWRQVAAGGGGAALVAGWGVLAGLVPEGIAPAGRLTLLAAAGWGLGLAAQALQQRGRGGAATLAGWGAGWGVALGGAWWLVGAPTTDAGMGLVLGPFGGCALVMALVQRILARAATPWTALTAALALAAGLSAAGVPPAWLALALVLVVAAIGGFVGGQEIGWRLPMAVGLAGLAGAALLRFGTGARGGMTRMDLAALLCLLALWLRGRVSRHLAPAPPKRRRQKQKPQPRSWPREMAVSAGVVVLTAGGVWLGGRLGLR